MNLIDDKRTLRSAMLAWRGSLSDEERHLLQEFIVDHVTMAKDFLCDSLGRILFAFRVGAVRFSPSYAIAPFRVHQIRTYVDFSRKSSLHFGIGRSSAQRSNGR